MESFPSTSKNPPTGENTTESNIESVHAATSPGGMKKIG